jgi:homotetrameric cytidine deaminase
MKSYSPYSRRTESCFIEGESGKFYPGVRVENISYPLSISAVQAAICSCLGNGDRPIRLYNTGEKSELFEQWISEFNIEQAEPLSKPPLAVDFLMPSDTDVEKALHSLTKKAVTIHSSFPVSALLEVENGFIPGVNIEVEAWALGLCAERVAISRAITAGYTEFKSIRIYAPKGDFCSPCGACRQVLAEFMPQQTAELHHGNGTLSKHIISHLLPYGFTSGSLKTRS